MVEAPALSSIPPSSISGIQAVPLIPDRQVQNNSNQAMASDSPASDPENFPILDTQSSPDPSLVSSNTSVTASSTQESLLPHNKIRLKICACYGTPSYAARPGRCPCTDICTVCEGHDHRGPYIQVLHRTAGFDMEIDAHSPSFAWFRICRCRLPSRDQFCELCNGYPLHHDLVLDIKNVHGGKITAS